MQRKTIFDAQYQRARARLGSRANGRVNLAVAILVRDIEFNGERNRGIYILKSRGMQHSNQIREFLITPEGVKLVDVYVGPEGVLTGSSRQAQEAREAATTLLTKQSVERKRREYRGAEHRSQAA